ncbi:Serine hydroxymethyltransferase, cytosolic [Basidiobolus ranarum]|uniref:Serine hydroxymethyltransferase, cytosolic n=1 Tax=Basidiobolus ranarum TaxID=34480 RepID=A0ABR2WYD6_9FUNG
MTSRGLNEADFEKIAGFIDRAVKIAAEADKKAGGSKLKDFKAYVGDGSHIAEVSQLKEDVIEFSRRFPTVGFNESEMKYAL